jgi:hypothetical protein
MSFTLKLIACEFGFFFVLYLQFLGVAAYSVYFDNCQLKGSDCTGTFTVKQLMKDNQTTVFQTSFAIMLFVATAVFNTDTWKEDSKEKWSYFQLLMLFIHTVVTIVFFYVPFWQEQSKEMSSSIIGTVASQNAIALFITGTLQKIRTLTGKVKKRRPNSPSDH